MINLFGEDTPDVPLTDNTKFWYAGTKHGNPCVKVFGKGPESTTCKTCIQLACLGHNGKNYYKCHRRGVSASQTTDHRVNWPSCGKYEPQPPTAS